MRILDKPLGIGGSIFSVLGNTCIRWLGKLLAFTETWGNKGLCSQYIL